MKILKLRSVVINRQILLFSVISLFAFGTSVNAQYLKKPAEGKALVYFIRGNAVGNGYNIRVYDNRRYLGPLPGRVFFAYECDPGKHLFWAASENRDYVEANLEADKVYVIDLRAKIGLVHMAVGVEPYSPENPKHVKRFKKALKKHIHAVVYEPERSAEKEENIEKALEVYEKIKDNKHSKIKTLKSDMSFTEEDVK